MPKVNVSPDRTSPANLQKSRSRCPVAEIHFRQSERVVRITRAVGNFFRDKVETSVVSVFVPNKLNFSTCCAAVAKTAADNSAAAFPAELSGR